MDVGTKFRHQVDGMAGELKHATNTRCPGFYPSAIDKLTKPIILNLNK